MKQPTTVEHGAHLSLDVEVLPLDVEAALIAAVKARNIDVPPSPGVALELNNMLARDDYSTSSLSLLVRRDEALAAAVLRTANSASMAAAGGISNLDDALVRIGAARLREIAFAIALGRTAHGTGPLQIVREALWHRAMIAATMCEAVAPGYGIEAAQGMVCGLLSEFSKVIIIGVIENVLAQQTQAVQLTAAQWEGVVSRHQGDIGLIIGALWRLPTPLAEVVAASPPAAHSGDTRQALLMVRDTLAAVALSRGGCAFTVDALHSVGGIDHQYAPLFTKAMRTISNNTARFMSAGSAPATEATSAWLREPGTTNGETEGTTGIHASFGQDTGTRYEVGQLSGDGFVLVGRPPRAENFVSKVTFVTPASEMEIFSIVDRVVKHPTAPSRLHCRPWMLAGPAELAWRNFVRKVS